MDRITRFCELLKGDCDNSGIDLLLVLEPIPADLLSADSTSSFTAMRGLGFFSAVIAPFSSSSIAAFLFRLASVAWNMAVRSTSLLDWCSICLLVGIDDNGTSLSSRFRFGKAESVADRIRDGGRR